MSVCLCVIAGGGLRPQDNGEGSRDVGMGRVTPLSLPGQLETCPGTFQAN